MTKSKEELLDELIKERTAKRIDAPKPAVNAGNVPEVSEEPPAATDAVPRIGGATFEIGGTTLSVADMAGHDWAEEPHPPYALTAKLIAGPMGEWRVELEWPQPAPERSSVNVFRVISADGQAPETFCSTPSDTHGVTTGSTFTDDTSVNGPLAASRFYEVWRYSGESVADAIARPPYRYAEGHLIWPAVGLEHDFDNGQVVVHWRVLGDGGASYGWARQLPREANNRPSVDSTAPAAPTGFVDPTPEQGRTYVYTVFTGAMVAGELEWGEVPARFNITIPEVLAPVLDLTVGKDTHRPNIVHLSWSKQRGGTVEIYRSDAPPAAEIHLTGEVDESVLVLPEYNLRPADRVMNPALPEGDRMTMRDVPIPAGQAETYFTPVTRSGTECHPGRTQSWLRPVPPENPAAHDRLDWVLVVFTWPAGASQVNLYVTAPGVVIDPVSVQPVASISRDEHLGFGGFQIDRSLLPSGPAELHLCGYKLRADDEAYSEPVTVPISFPALVEYTLTTRIGLFRSRKLTLALAGQVSVPGAEFVLAWRPDSLPLAREDAAKILCKLPKVTVPAAGGPSVPIELTDMLTEKLPTSGFMRLLVRPDSNIALIDPPVAQLTLAAD